MVFLALPENEAKKIEIEDFAYDRNLSLVIILDYVKGVYFFNI